VNFLKKIRVAVPTNGDKGLEDTVSEVFSRANTFTIVDLEEKKIKDVKVLRNSALDYKSGVGPIVIKMLADSNVNVVLAGEIGPGATTLLEQNKIEKIKVEPGITVAEAIKNAGLVKD